MLSQFWPVQNPYPIAKKPPGSKAIKNGSLCHWWNVPFGVGWYLCYIWCFWLWKDSDFSVPIQVFKLGRYHVSWMQWTWKQEWIKWPVRRRSWVSWNVPTWWKTRPTCPWRLVRFWFTPVSLWTSFSVINKWTCQWWLIQQVVGPKCFVRFWVVWGRCLLHYPQIRPTSNFTIPLW